ncbi:MAG: DUF4386 domain-containing protein [Chthoniobacterales bacterium]|nr:DUF4386 domain-containing protein [Chthoniobacterales bacterium]
MTEAANSPNNLTLAQHAAAKIVGILYLVTMATSIIGFVLRGPMFARGDAVETATRIAASERLYRLSLVTDLITVAGVIVLLWAIYVVLKPVEKNVALLAAFFRLAENIVLSGVTLCGFATVALLGAAPHLRAFAATELQALIYTLAVRVHGAGFNVGFVFLGLGSTVFAYLWLKSGYIPRWIAIWGILSSLLLSVVTLGIMIFPRWGALGLLHMMPLGLFEVGLGLWLLIKGLRTPLA